MIASMPTDNLLSPEMTFDFPMLIQPIPEQAEFSDPDYYIWGASMIRDADGLCHLYYSRWPRRAGFYAWVTCSEIAHAVAENPLGPYVHQDVALAPRGLEHWDGVCTHNPTIHFFDGHYHLYYMGLTADAGCSGEISVEDPAWWTFRNQQRIGVAVADSPNGPWMRKDGPLIDVSVDPDAPDSLMISNPSVTRKPNGDYLLIYKAVGKKRSLPFGGPVVHLSATGSSPDGPFSKNLEPIFTHAGCDFPAEDPYVWFQRSHQRYYAIVKDMVGCFTGAGRSLALLESVDGKLWQPAPHTLVSDLTVRMESGAIRKLGNLERPQLWRENDHPRVLFLAAAQDLSHSSNLHVPLAHR